MTSALRSALLSTVPLLALAGCETPGSYFAWQKHAEVVEFIPEPLYCYRTLARSDCFAQPLDGRESDRLVGYYGPPPGRVAGPVRASNGKAGEVIDHPPLMVPREAVEAETLPLPPPASAPRPPTARP